MDKSWIKLAAGLLAGFGIGYIIQKRRADELEVKRDALIDENNYLEGRCEDLARSNDNLREVNRWQTELLTKEEES